MLGGMSITLITRDSPAHMAPKASVMASYHMVLRRSKLASIMKSLSLRSASLRLSPFSQGNDEHAGAHQDLAAQIAGQNLVGGGFGGKGGDFRLGDAPLQPLDAEVCDGGQEDQNFAQHHEDDG